MGGELSRLGLLQLVERKRSVGGQASSPAWPGIEQVGTGEGEQQDRQVAEPRRKQLDQVEEASIGPVDVLENEHRRPVAGDGLDEDPYGEEQRLTVGDRALAVQPEHDREVARHFSRFRGPE